MITVYTKDRCPQCLTTKSALKRHGIAYTEVNVQKPENEKLVDMLREKGFGSLPVVDTGNEMWAGFQPDRIEALK